MVLKHYASGKVTMIVDSRGKEVDYRAKIVNIEWFRPPQKGKKRRTKRSRRCTVLAFVAPLKV